MQHLRNRSVWLNALFIAIAWQLLMTVLGFALDHYHPVRAVADITPLSHTSYWDGGWYMSIIANHSYSLNAASPVFYPLFPAAVAAVQLITLHALSLTAAGLIVNTIAVWLAIVGLIGIIKTFTDKYVWLAVALFLLSPAAVFLHLFYVEALFCALAFWAYLFALRKQWLYMGLTLALLTAAKLPAVLIIGLCGLEFMRAYDWNIKKTLCNRNLLYFALAPLGFIAYGLYMLHLRGDFLAMFHGYDATDDWAYHVFNPNFLSPILEAGKHTIKMGLGLTPYDGTILVNFALPFAGLFLLGLASLYAIFKTKGKLLPLGITGLVSIVFFSLNSNLISVHRYLLPSVILYLVPVLLAKKYPKSRFILYGALFVCFAIQIVLFRYFVSSRFAG